MIFFLLFPSPSVGKDASFPFFSDYRNIRGVYDQNGSFWLVSPCDGIVFEYHRESSTWKTYFAQKDIDFEDGALCSPDEVKLFEEGNAIVFHSTDEREADEYFFETGTKRFGIRKQAARVPAKADDGYRVVEESPYWKDPYGEPKSGLVIVERKGKEKFYGLPRTNPKDFYSFRPTHPRNDFLPTIDEKIGVSQRLGDQIWFGISYYEGEGFDGVGGVGYFDLLTRKYHIFRPPILRNWSVKVMHIEWPFMWLSTQGNYELSRSPGTGLLMIDLRTLSSKKPNISRIKLSDLGVEDISLIATARPYLWVISVSGIHRFNKITYKWDHFKVKLRIVKEVVPTFHPFYPAWVYYAERKPGGGYLSYKYEPGDFVNYNGSVDSYHQQLKKYLRSYEVEGKLAIEGFVWDRYISNFWCRGVIMKGGWHKDCGPPIAVYDAEDVSYRLGAFWKGPIEVVSSKKWESLHRGMIKKVRIRSVWIPGDSALPVIEKIQRR